MTKAIWQWLGFGKAELPIPAPNPEFPELAFWPMMFKLNRRTRLRLLLSDKVSVTLVARTKVKIEQSVPAANLSVLPPGKEKAA